MNPAYPFGSAASVQEPEEPQNTQNKKEEHGKEIAVGRRSFLKASIIAGGALLVASGQRTNDSADEL